MRHALTPARSIFLLLGIALFVGGCDPRDPAGREGSQYAGLDGTLLHRILIVQDARDTSREGRRTLERGLRARAPGIRVIAARAVGRMESEALIPLLFGSLGDLHPGVRAEAANAVAQAAYRAGASAAASALVPRLEVERDPEVRGVLYQSLGRLPFESMKEVESAEGALAGAVGGRDLAAVEEYGLVRGVGSLALRRRQLGAELSPFVLSRLGGAAYAEETGGAATEFTPDAAAYVRRAAMDGLLRARAAEPALLASARLNPDPEVRRLSAAGAAALRPSPRDDILDDLLRDPHPQVRLEALRALAGAGPASSLRCDPWRDGLSDPSVHVRVLAASAPREALGCVGAPGGPGREDLTALAGSLSKPGAAVHWQVATAALGTLAAAWPADAADLLPSAVEHPLWQVRMEAAPIAGRLSDVEAVRTLARDPDHNVREAALRALFALVGRGGDQEYLEALDSRDPQLVMTASRLLEGTPERDEALPELLTALGWFTAFGGETSRDVRSALLERIGELGGLQPADQVEGMVEELGPLAEDGDAVVAAAAAHLLSDWTGHPVRPRPTAERRMSRMPAPGVLAGYARSRIVFEMEDGGPFLAPGNSHRLMTQALSGVLEGLTFHRIVPNFVVQGLSPGANEYWGHGGFTRDELGIPSNIRGSVGLSTRGRDSGDGQIYVNLVDNLRLDHNYTVFGTVVEGMDVVDGLTAGAVVATVTVEGPAAN
jgi:cyclophilin family peptidyl-prolyl cis-trans isomerase/HEAT repeat protein